MLHINYFISTVCHKKRPTFNFLNNSSKISRFQQFLPCDAMHKRDLCRHAVSVCVSVCLCVRHVRECVKTNKYLQKNFHRRVAKPFYFFCTKQYSDRNPPNGGVECRWGRQKSWFWAYIWLHCICCEVFQR